MPVMISISGRPWASARTQGATTRSSGAGTIVNSDKLCAGSSVEFDEESGFRGASGSGRFFGTLGVVAGCGRGGGGPTAEILPHFEMIALFARLHVHRFLVDSQHPAGHVCDLKVVAGANH